MWRKREREKHDGKADRERYVLYAGTRKTDATRDTTRKKGVAEGTLEKERRSAAGSWLAGVVEAGANEPFFTPVGR